MQAFGATKPQTAEGVIMLARALVALGQPERARALLSPFWRTEKLDGEGRGRDHQGVRQR